MNSKTLFTETQKFKQWWTWLILLGINGFFLFAVYKQIIGKQPFGDKPMSDLELLVVAVLIILLTVLFLNFRLETTINKDGIYVRFFPFFLKPKYYPWESLTKCYVRNYSPIREYGGWGLRIGLFGKGAAFNVSGNMGLQLEFSNNKKLLIGTNKPEELTKVLSEIGQLKQ